MFFKYFLLTCIKCIVIWFLQNNVHIKVYWTGFMKAALFDYSYINVGSLNAVVINVPFQHQKVSHPTLGALQGGFFWGETEK